MPAFPYQKKLIDIWFWRLDCLGDLRPKWAHMLDFYPEQIARIGIQDVWKHSPLSLETCWVPGYWKEQGWDVHYILGEALRWHVTSVNIKSSAIPPEFAAAFEDFERKMGYRLELRRIEYPGSVRSGSAAPVKMWWVNSGVAPAYRPYILALAFASAGVQEAVDIPADVRKWLPGDVVVEEDIDVPLLKAGEYGLRVALLDPRTRKPAIRLGIEGRNQDGWYDLGSISVQ